MPEDLLMRLQNLENSYYGDKEAARQQSFMDTYGGRFSNNRGLGMAILNELDARGIDTSAADEAVQQILDTLRTECNEIIESIKDVQESAIENARKVEEVANVVDDVVAGNSSATVSPDVPVAGTEEAITPGIEAPMEPNPDALMPEGGEMPPAESPAEGTPPAEGGEMPPAEPPVEPPAEPPAPGPEEMPPEQIPSDERIKRIRAVVSDRRMKRIKSAASNSYKPSASILEIAQRGY